MIYEYKCDDCNYVWSLHRKVKDRTNEAICEKCGGDGKVCISAPHVHFSTFGFPSNDMRYKIKDGVENW